MMDVNQAAQAMMEAEIEDFLEGFSQPTYRGMRANGVPVQTWSSQHGWSGITPPPPFARWLVASGGNGPPAPGRFLSQHQKVDQ
jgi:hypothetical protein